MDESRSKERKGAFWPMLLLVLVAGAVLLALQARRPQPVSPWAGRELPPLGVGGWLNSARPISDDDVRGKVVLVDFWATWCGPCTRHIPELVKFHRRYADQGVVMIGLTSESADDVERIQQFVKRWEMPWAIGYGSGVAFNALGINALPTYLLYDRSGRSVWGGHSLVGLEEAVVGALAR